ncbi:hypothetical protein PR202_gn00864 [Eleusine coracana subsp. coracana]|uniref:Chlorophyll a-b binding protein, chloroplastic n=1 Tax=Eleusine coracana subsp. coracana TaxID=191504 RepID=A0AAV5G4K1_ELECO|nr:hypothetical protein PR202_gn00864 [Eleusine coracana subsp. coracana]
MATTTRSLAAFSSSTSAASRAARPGPSRVSISGAEREQARRLVAEFDRAVPLACAVTPPSGWYTDPDFLQLEIDRVFLRGWQAVGHIWQVKNPNDFFTGRIFTFLPNTAMFVVIFSLSENMESKPDVSNW